MSVETQLRDDMARLSKSLFDRGYSVGTAGNISARVEDGLLITPTNSCLGFLDPARISKLSPDGQHLAGDPPSKEVVLHRAFYQTRPQAGAVVHLHSTCATALSCLTDTDPMDCVPPLTPYVVMRVGRVCLLPYVRPGHPAMGEMIRKLAGSHAAVLLANHGPVVSGPNLAATVAAAEELEETAKLLLLLRGAAVRLLTPDNTAELARVFAPS